MRALRPLVPCLLLFAVAAPAFADAPGVPATHTGPIQAERTDHPVLLDGALDELSLIQI